MQTDPDQRGGTRTRSHRRQKFGCRSSRRGAETRRHLEVVCLRDGLLHHVDAEASEVGLSSEAKSAAAACGRPVVFGALGAKGRRCPDCSAALTLQRKTSTKWGRAALRCLCSLRRGRGDLSSSLRSATRAVAGEPQ